MLCGTDEGEFVNLHQKHNFNDIHFGMLIGMLRKSLIELQVCLILHPLSSLYLHAYTY